MSTSLHSVSVAGVTFDAAGRALIIRRRDNGQWQAPGGVLELHESFEDGVAREVLEETGVRVEAERLTGVYKNLRAGVVALVYRCVRLSGTPTATDEASDVAWKSLADIEKLMTPAFFVRVLDAQAPDRASPASRSHDGVLLL